MSHCSKGAAAWLLKGGSALRGDQPDLAQKNAEIGNCSSWNCPAWVYAVMACGWSNFPLIEFFVKYGNRRASTSMALHLDKLGFFQSCQPITGGIPFYVEIIQRSLS